MLKSGASIGYSEREDKAIEPKGVRQRHEVMLVSEDETRETRRLRAEAGYE